MTLNLTPEKFRTMGFGADLDDIEDVELASLLARAQTIADAYCSVPRLPLPHSFLGGEITAAKPEQHHWRLPESEFDEGSRRIYPYHWPIKAITAFRVKVTNTQYVDIGPAEIFLNNTERYAEVISLAFTGVGLFGAILPTLGLMHPVSEIAYTYGYEFPVVGEVVYATDARTYRAANQHWVAGSWKVYLDDVEQTSDFTVDPYEGTVQFTNGISGVVSVDYSYVLPPEIRDALGIIGTHLIAEREVAGRGMGAVQSLKVGEVSLTNLQSRSRKLTAATLADILPEAAALLDGFNFITVR